MEDSKEGGDNGGQTQENKDAVGQIDSSTGKNNSGQNKENIDGFTSSENLITGKSGAQATGGTVQTQYWREID